MRPVAVTCPALFSALIFWSNSCPNGLFSPITVVAPKYMASVYGCVPVLAVRFCQHAAAKAVLKSPPSTGDFREQRVLPRKSRMTSSADFSYVMKHGHKSGGRAFVVFVAPQTGSDEATAPQLGLIVSKACGNAVQRNRIKRQIRHHIRRSSLTGKDAWVVRALPGVHQIPDQRRSVELDRCMSNALAKRNRRSLAADSS